MCVSLWRMVDLSCNGKQVPLLQYMCLTMYMRCVSMRVRNGSFRLTFLATEKCSRSPSVLPLIRYLRPDYRWYTSKLPVHCKW